MKLIISESDGSPCTRHDMRGILCISRKGYLCLHDGPCEPCDRDGNVTRPVIDAEEMNVQLRRGAVLQTFRHGTMEIEEVTL